MSGHSLKRYKQDAAEMLGVACDTPIDDLLEGLKERYRVVIAPRAEPATKLDKARLARAIAHRALLRKR